MNFYKPTLFDFNDEKWNDHLNEYGYVVLKDILSQTEINDSMELFKQDINSVSPNFDINNNETFTINNTPIMWGKGIAVFNGFGQSNFMWSLRTNSKIQNIYKKIHNCDELVTSLDGFSLFVSKTQKSSPWLHIDQNPNNNIYSIQGSYNFMPVNNDDAGFICIPKSHITFSPKIKHKNDWVICENQKDLVKKSVKLIIPANCFVLWNSRLIHANEGMKKNSSTINRLTTYITFMPKNLRSENILNQKIEAYKNGKSTSHWANKCEIKKYPYGYKNKYESRNFKNIIPYLDENSNIPSERLELL